MYGEPYGDFNRRPPPRAVVRVAKPAPGRPTLNLNGDPVARRSVRDLDASSALAAAARARSDFNRLVHVRDDPRAADAAYTRVASCPTLPGWSATCAPRSEPRAPLHKGERDILIDAFRALDPPDARGERSGVVDPAAFVSAWDSLGVRVTPVLAVAAINKACAPNPGTGDSRTPRSPRRSSSPRRDSRTCPRKCAGARSSRASRRRSRERSSTIRVARGCHAHGVDGSRLPSRPPRGKTRHSSSSTCTGTRATASRVISSTPRARTRWCTTPRRSGSCTTPPQT